MFERMPADAFLSDLLELPDERPHVHAFHPYPARFAPALAGALLADAPAGAVAFDPFAGSATTLVEARLRGLRAWGNDLNPIAGLLCRVKADPLPPNVLGALRGDLDYLRKYVAGRLRSRDECEHVKLPPGERIFDPHVYWELQTILGGVARLRHPHNREIFSAALSAIVTKVSRQQRESAPTRRRENAVGGRRTVNLFFEAADDLLERLAAFSRLAKGGALRVWEDDARELTGVPAAGVDVVVTSPPYGGTYDYALMHAARNLWLDLDWSRFAALEIGARRTQGDREALAAFRVDFERVFAALRRVVKPGAPVYWVVADGVFRGRAYRGDELSTEAAAGAGWRLARHGEAARPAWSEAEQKAYGARGKFEYLLHFV